MKFYHLQTIKGCQITTFEKIGTSKNSLKGIDDERRRYKNPIKSTFLFFLQRLRLTNFGKFHFSIPIVCEFLFTLKILFLYFYFLLLSSSPL